MFFFTMVSCTERTLALEITPPPDLTQFMHMLWCMQALMNVEHALRNMEYVYKYVHTYAGSGPVSWTACQLLGHVLMKELESP